jgi:hypothetical protein
MYVYGVFHWFIASTICFTWSRGLEDFVLNISSAKLRDYVFPGYSLRRGVRLPSSLGFKDSIHFLSSANRSIRLIVFA